MHKIYRRNSRHWRIIPTLQLSTLTSATFSERSREWSMHTVTGASGTWFIDKPKNPWLGSCRRPNLLYFSFILNIITNTNSVQWREVPWLLLLLSSWLPYLIILKVWQKLNEQQYCEYWSSVHYGRWRTPGNKSIPSEEKKQVSKQRLVSAGQCMKPERFQLK